MASRAPAATERVAELLTTQPATAADLARRAELGNSTVTKALAALETAGRARRTPGGRQGGRRLPDQWTIITARGPAKANGAPRLGRGELRTAVLAFLRTHLGQEFTATALAKALGHSAGAISNAAEKLLLTGEVARTNESPRSYSAAPPLAR